MNGDSPARGAWETPKFGSGREPDPHATPIQRNHAGRLGPMDLEESSHDQLGDRCEECGAKLTPQELQAAMESGGPALCSIHAAEDEPGLEADEAGFIEGQ